ncbi:hypothetical protein AVEN_191713-1, partial [Araneus ventricosus]
ALYSTHEGKNVPNLEAVGRRRALYSTHEGKNVPNLVPVGRRCALYSTHEGKNVPNLVAVGRRCASYNFSNYFYTHLISCITKFIDDIQSINIDKYLEYRQRYT